MIAFVDNIHQ